MKLIKRVFDRRGTPVLIFIFLVLSVIESRRQLRRRVQPRLKRALTNSLVSIPSFTLLRFLLIPVMVKLATKNQIRKGGIYKRYKLPSAVQGVITFLLLDITNYFWHILNHKVPILWRFHVVHHCDPDLDVTTAFRFHFGELIGSVFYRGACVFLTGASPLTVLIYEVAFEGATQFHHSNIMLPYSVEKTLNKFMVTPRMHGIHHSVIRNETDSNYSVIFSFWDRLNNTIRLNVRQQAIVTGVPAYSNHAELTTRYLLKLPFTKIRPWSNAKQEREPEDIIHGKTNLAR